MRYLSVCSGIEAASVAWHPLGWEPVAFSEIDPFASAVLAARFPSVPNLGNMEGYRDWPIEPGSIDLLVGGTPCQSFSVAGLRKGLDDPRGNLALVYLGLVDRFRPRWIVWENVPGVLSSSGGRDFGAFLGGLAQLGYGFAYRVLDAQYVRVESHPHAVPQRRRRVFVVGCAGDWRSAAEVLLEPEGVRGDSAPRREARKGVARGAEDGARSGGVAVTVADPLPFDTTQVTHPANRSVPRPGDPCHPLARVRHAPAVALGFEPRYYLRDNRTGGGPADTVALTASERAGDSAPHVATMSGFDVQNDTATMQVRRLTPRECERLQGFPDDWTAITYRGKPAADGPRYKALGNSMAVNVMAFIGERIDRMGKSEHTLSTNDEVCTPAAVYDRIVEILGPIGFDPCSHPASTVPSETQVLLPRYWTDPLKPCPAEEDNGEQLTIWGDGLRYDWGGMGLVYVNPPYSLLPKEPWVAKARDEADEAVLLLPVRTAGAWWQDEVTRCAAVTFLRGRVQHAGEEQGAPFHQALVYCGPRADLWLAKASALGWTVRAR